MKPEDFEAPLDAFSEYAMAVENDDYPKTDFTQLQFRGPVDPAAMAEAHDDAIALVPIFSSHLVERRRGLLYRPRWVFDREVPNRLRVEDCRHVAGDPFDPMDFSTRHYELRIRQRMDLTREFPCNCSLLRVGDEEHILSLQFHHSCMDAHKGYLYLTRLLAGYHERIKGKAPDWADSQGMAALTRQGDMVKPVSAGRFIREQLADVFWRNRSGSVSNIASEEVRDYREVRGRYSLRAVIEDPAVLQGLFDRARAHHATVNDLFFAVTRRVLSRWNRDHGASDDRFRFMLITSIKGRTRQSEAAGAGVSGLNFVSTGQGGASLDTLMQFFRDVRRDQLARGIDIRFNQAMCRMVGAARLLPLRKRSRLLNPVVNSIPCTFSLSNLGVVWPRMENGRPTLDSEVLGAGDFVISDIHSSASAGRSVGLALAVRIHQRRMYLNFVADRFRFREPEARELVDRFVRELTAAHEPGSGQEGE
ncbi:MAG: hypothetical protein ISR64_00430 [Deltaproteobacteria bacterium]|nr:hypothetical protein [Deltaproteobacteria bacterium]